MSIFTKNGDNGETSLFGGARVRKSSQIIEAIGSVDELSSVIAILEGQLKSIGMTDLSDKMEQIINELFKMGADLANPKKHENLPDSFVSVFDVESLEADITKWETELPPLTHFVLPAGNDVALTAYWARAVCRRAERNVVAEKENGNINPLTAKYLNRLADWLFICFRLINHRKNQKERFWNA